jgi:hypothetical protein
MTNSDYFMWKKGCQEYYKEYHRLLKIVAITEDPIFVEDLQGVNVYFKDNDGRFVTHFKVVRVIPESTEDHTDYYMKVYFLEQNEIVNVQLLKIIDHLNTLQKTALLSFLQANYSQKLSKVNHILDKRHLAFSEAVGDDPTTRTELQEEEKQRLAAEEPEQYVGAYIYCDADKRIMLYQPDLALDRN